MLIDRINLVNRPKQKLLNSALQNLVNDEIRGQLGWERMHVSWLAGDGSNRSYYRLDNLRGTTYVLMHLSQEDQKKLASSSYDWITLGHILAHQNIHVPKLIRSFPSHGMLVIEDYGDVMLETEVSILFQKKQWSNIEQRYKECFKVLQQFLNIPKEDHAVWCRRRFDAQRFAWELNFFKKHFLDNFEDLSLNKIEQQAFDFDVENLATYLSSLPTFFVHRDFHSRNLMIKDNKIAVIDFQDARLGPLSYDLVSLCFDPYVDLPPKLRFTLLKHAEEFCFDEKSLRKDFQNQWRAMALQRLLKAIGTYGYLTLEKKRGHYLGYVQPSLDLLNLVDPHDDRWPFLSKEFIRKLDQKWPQS